jgi:AraC-like DNA-binding protein
VSALYSRSRKWNGTKTIFSNLAAAKTAVGRVSAFAVAGQQERISNILQKIESEPCKIHDLALEFNLSHSHLQHLFKEQTGVSLGHLLTEQRLHRAAYLLTHTNLRIKEIADVVGYEHPSSFIRAFERHFNQAPRLYRQQNRCTKSPRRTKS